MTRKSINSSVKPRIYCSYTKLVDPNNLKGNPKNPTQHPKAQIELLAKIIRQHGWRTSITVSNRSGLIVRGHGRHEAALLLGLKEVPVDYQDYANEAVEYADLLADNRISELSDMDRATLKDVMDSLNSYGYDLSLTAYSEHEVSQLLDMWTPGHDQLPDRLPNLGIEGDDMRSGRIILVYTTDEEKEALFRLLGIDGAKVVYTIRELLDKKGA